MSKKPTTKKPAKSPKTTTTKAKAKEPKAKKVVR